MPRKRRKRSEERSKPADTSFNAKKRRKEARKK
jgi:hypothetical protein